MLETGAFLSKNWQHERTIIIVMRYLYHEIEYQEFNNIMDLTASKEAVDVLPTPGVPVTKILGRCRFGPSSLMVSSSGNVACLCIFVSFSFFHFVACSDPMNRTYGTENTSRTGTDDGRHAEACDKENVEW
jgi:hypothetical protein